MTDPPDTPDSPDAPEQNLPPSPQYLRRRRRRASPKWKVLLLISVVLVVWCSFEAYWQMTAVPMPMVDYHARLHDLAASYQPVEGGNGWETLIEALVVFLAVQGEAIDLEVTGDWLSEQPYARDLKQQYVDYGSFRTAPHRPDRFPRVVHALNGFRDDGVNDLIDDAIASPRMLRPPSTGGMLISVGLGDLSKLREMGKSQAAAMHHAAASGDMDELIASYDRILGIGRACGGQSFLIERLVGIAINALAFGEMRPIIIERELDEPTCQALLAVMDRQCDWPPWELQLEAERCGMLDIVQNVFTDDGHGDGRLDANKLGQLGGFGIGGGITGGGGGALGHVSSIFLAGRRETTDMINEFFDRLIEHSRLDRTAREADDFNMDMSVEQLSPRFMLVRQLLPALGRIPMQEDLNRQQQRATRIMLHLELHRLLHGDYPETLDVLSGDIEPQTLIDPMNGEPFAYRRMAPDAWGRTYVLYSLGVDGVDDEPDRSLKDLESDFPELYYPEFAADILLNRRRVDRADIED